MLPRKRKRGLETGADRRGIPRHIQALAASPPCVRLQRACLLLTFTKAVLTSSQRLSKRSLGSEPWNGQA